MTKAEKHIVVIEKIVLGGDGLARLDDGQVLLVPFVLPGERVLVEIHRRRKGYVLARLLEVLEASTHRITPHCPHFQSCGGCHLQHAAYISQTEIKQEILAETLKRGGLLGGESGVLEPFLGCATPFNYRQRIRLQVDEAGRVGFYKTASNQVHEVGSCPLAMEPLNEVLADLRGFAGLMIFLEHISSIELMCSPADHTVCVIFHLSRKVRPADRKMALQLADGIDLLEGVYFAGEGFAMQGPFPGSNTGAEEFKLGFSLPVEAQARTLDFTFDPGGFCQVNLGQNQRLVAQMLDWAKVSAKERVLDLYCGMGNFSLPLSGAAEVIGMDLQRSSIRNAKLNANANRIDNCHFIRSDALAAAADLSKLAEEFDLILLDPPRKGCRDIISVLPGFGADRIIYISCDPATLVRDLADLAAIGYQLVRIGGVDMFPQTRHLEVIALLRRPIIPPRQKRHRQQA